jgi:hypothetical protein
MISETQTQPVDATWSRDAIADAIQGPRDTLHLYVTAEDGCCIVQRGIPYWRIQLAGGDLPPRIVFAIFFGRILGQGWTLDSQPSETSAWFSRPAQS